MWENISQTKNFLYFFPSYKKIYSYFNLKAKGLTISVINSLILKYFTPIFEYIEILTKKYVIHIKPNKC